MICYICANRADKAIKMNDSLTVAYCDEHADEVAIGITEFMLKGTLDRLISYKDKYTTAYKGSAYNEFVKCKSIEEMWCSDDSSVTEQGI